MNHFYLGTMQKGFLFTLSALYTFEMKEKNEQLKPTMYSLAQQSIKPLSTMVVIHYGLCSCSDTDLISAQISQSPNQLRENTSSLKAIATNSDHQLRLQTILKITSFAERAMTVYSNAHEAKKKIKKWTNLAMMNFIFVGKKKKKKKC